MTDFNRVKKKETTLHLREQGEELGPATAVNEVAIPPANESAEQLVVTSPESAKSKTMGGTVIKRRKRTTPYLGLAVKLLCLSVGVLSIILWANCRFAFQTAPEIASKVLLSPPTRELKELNGWEWDPHMDGFSGVRNIRFVSHKPVTLRNPSKWQYQDRLFYSTHYEGYKQDVVARVTSQFPFDKDIQKMKRHIDSIEIWSGKGFLLHDKKNDLYLFHAEM